VNDGSYTRRSKTAVLRLSDRVESICQKSIGLWPFGAEWTYIRVLLVALFLAVSLVRAYVMHALSLLNGRLFPAAQYCKRARHVSSL
jgi:hypothetical protein